MLNRLRQLTFVNRKARWLGWCGTVHLTLSLLTLFSLVFVGINPTLLVSVLGAPLWIGVAFASKYLPDKIMED